VIRREISTTATDAELSGVILDPELSAVVLTAGRRGEPAALLLPYQAAAELAAEHGQADLPSFRLGNALAILLDLLWRATRLGQGSAITYQGRPVAAIVPTHWNSAALTTTYAPKGN